MELRARVKLLGQEEIHRGGWWSQMRAENNKPGCQRVGYPPYLPFFICFSSLSLTPSSNTSRGSPKHNSFATEHISWTCRDSVL